MATRKQEVRMTFDGFESPDVPSLCNARYVIHFTPGKGISYHKYSMGEKGIEPQACDLEVEGHLLTARANKFSVIDHIIGDKEKRSEEGYVYDGVLWLQPKKVDAENYGAGGRIFCWVPSKIKDLPTLVLENTIMPGQLLERIQAIKRGYKQQRIAIRESRTAVKKSCISRR